jgi:hypothetical protein
MSPPVTMCGARPSSCATSVGGVGDVWGGGVEAPGRSTHTDRDDDGDEAERRDERRVQRASSQGTQRAQQGEGALQGRVGRAQVAQHRVARAGGWGRAGGGAPATLPLQPPFPCPPHLSQHNDRLPCVGPWGRVMEGTCGVGLAGMSWGDGHFPSPSWSRCHAARPMAGRARKRTAKPFGLTCEVFLVICEGQRGQLRVMVRGWAEGCSSMWLAGVVCMVMCIACQGTMCWAQGRHVGQATTAEQAQCRHNAGTMQAQCRHNATS